ncbi:MAG: hypothetical protein IKY65_06825 [Rikenellaceae bacterium]|nr:hypothetical protein [Rikenellaceae bacterium]
MMKRILNILLLLAVAVNLCSCSEADRVGDPTAPDGNDYVIDYGTLYIAEGVTDRYIIRDDGIALLVSSDYSGVSTANPPIISGNRVLINYHVLGDLDPMQVPESCKAGYAIQLNALLAIPCQQITLGQEPTRECSPVVVSSIHIGKAHLDLRLDYKSLTNQKHKFELYCPDPDAQVLDLYLVHIGDDDKNNSGAMISSHRISFDTTPLRSDEPRKIVLHWVDITGAKRGHRGEYNTWP